MRILHVIGSVSRLSGGPATAVLAMSRALTAANVDSEIVTTDDDGGQRRLQTDTGQAVRYGGTLVRFFPRQLRTYSYSRPMSRWLDKQVCNYDVVHCHGLFCHSPIAGSTAARRQGRPYIVRPVGVLNRWGLANRRRIAKKISLLLLERPILQHAACIHATSISEKDDIALQGVRRPIEVIPLGLDIDSLNAASTDDGPNETQADYLVYLGRLHPIKRIELLLEAFSKLLRHAPELELVVAGCGEPEYETFLKGEANRLGVAQNVSWPGFVAGPRKARLLREAAVSVLPSDSENFGVAAAESMALGTPIVVRRGVGLAKFIADNNCGLVSGDSADELANDIVRILANEELAESMSRSSAAAALREFGPKRTAQRLVEMYERAQRGAYQGT